MQLLVRGRVSLYGAAGQYQLYAEDMQPEGLGSLHLAFTQLKEKLQKEGLFDVSKKKPIPVYPQRIGIITSKTGAVLHDILNILSRRYPIAEIVFYPVAVQGEKAAYEIANAIKYLNDENANKHIDVMIVGRGGGSIEDLWAFNEEIVARAVASSKIPIISAVGHETDFTICDFVADIRAPTPSAAAELATRDKEEILFEIKSYYLRIKKIMSSLINESKQNIDFIISSKCMQSCEFTLKQKRIDIDLISQRLKTSFGDRLKNYKEIFIHTSNKLEFLSPLKILQIGYCVASKDKVMLKSVSNIEKDDNLDIRFVDGQVNCKVLSKGGIENEKTHI
jgi:exodeoxyribonuclease VII large subunit